MSFQFINVTLFSSILCIVFSCHSIFFEVNIFFEVKASDKSLGLICAPEVETYFIKALKPKSKTEMNKLKMCNLT